MKKLQRALSIFLTFMLFVGILSISSFASDSTVAKDIDEIISSFNAPNGRLMCAAHKGNWRSFPENSIEGIQSCISMGVDIVEIDIQRTKDGHFILMEDSTLSRMCIDSGGNAVKAKVSEKTLAEIQSYKLRNYSGGVNAKVTDYKVPTLEEALKACKGHIMVLIDNAWKYSDEIQQILTEQDVNDIAIIRSAPGAEQISSYIQRNELPVAHLSGYYDGTFSIPAKSYIKKTLTAGAKIVELSSDKSYSAVFKKSVVKKFKGEGRAFVSMTEKELCGNREDIRSAWSDLASRGFSIIETDYPSDLVNYIEETKTHKATLSNLIAKAQGLNASNYSNESAKELKASLKNAEDISDKGCTSLEDVDEARYNLQESIDALTPRGTDESKISATAVVIIIAVVLVLILALYLYIRINRKKKAASVQDGSADPSPVRKKKRKKVKRPAAKQHRPDSDSRREQNDSTDYFDMDP